MVEPMGAQAGAYAPHEGPVMALVRLRARAAARYYLALHAPWAVWFLLEKRFVRRYCVDCELQKYSWDSLRKHRQFLLKVL